MFAANARYTLRSFRKSPGFAITAVLSLALGIGANTAIFSLLDRVMLRSLPVRDASQLVLFTANGPRRGSVNTAYDDTYTFSYPMYLSFRDRAPGLDGVIAWFPIAGSLSTGGSTERIDLNLVSGNFFDVLGARTVVGRPIAASDTAVIGSNPVAVLNYGFWQQSLGGDPGILNRQVTVNGQSLTIVGIAAPGFNGVASGEAPALFVPITMKPALTAGGGDMNSRRNMWLNMMARLKPGVSRKSVESALNAFWKPLLQDELSQFSTVSPQFRRNFLQRHITVHDASNGISMLRMLFAQPLTMLMGLVGLVLLIACANVANLLIARAASRQREIAIRLAVGATRGDIVRQILGEGLLLAVAGGSLGVLFAMWGGRALLGMLPFGNYTATISANPDWRILAFTATVSLLCGLAFGLAPALQTTRPDLASTMKEQTSGIISGKSHLIVRKGLVIAQVALSLLLLTTAGLFIRSLRNLESVDLGFRTDHLMSFSIQPGLNGYNARRAIALFDSLQQRIAGLPGVGAVASTQTPLLDNVNWDQSVVIPGYQPREGDNAPNVTSVSAGYFSALGIPLVAGREFRLSDNMAAPHVAVVNEAFARYYFGNLNPIGRQFYYGADKSKTPVEIVGISKDGKYSDIREEKQRFVFSPYAQQYDVAVGGMTYYVRTSQKPESITSALRQTVRDLDPNLPIYKVKTMEEQVDEDIFADRIVSLLSIFFGILATVLAAIGLYGVMSFAVMRRTREIGIRMALGAKRAEVLTLVLREVFLLAAIGIAVAVPFSFPLANLAKSMLYSQRPYDAIALAGAIAVLALTALASGYLPAARAARVDPLVALRNE